MFLPFIVGTTIRFVGLDRLSFWADEAYSVWFAEQPVGKILSSIDEIHPLGYYLFLHFWLNLGNTDWWTRVPSAVVGSATILALFALGSTLFDPRVGVGAAWLLGVSPWHVWYSQEARMYAAVCLFVTLAALFGARWLKQDDWRFAVAYVAMMLAGLYVDYSTLLAWPAEAVALPLLQTQGMDRRHLTGWIALQAVVAAGFLPQATLLRYHATVVPGFLTFRLSSVTPYVWIAIAVLGGLLLMASAGLFLIRRRHPETVHKFVRLGLVIAFVLSVVIAPIETGMTVKRVLLFSVPFLCLGGVWSTTRLRWPTSSLAALIVTSLAGLLLVEVALPKEAWRDVVDDLHAAARPGDLVLIAPSWNTTAFDHYDRGRIARDGFSAPDLAAALPTSIASRARVWLVLVAGPAGQATDTIGPPFTARFALQSRRDYYHISVRLYERQGT